MRDVTHKIEVGDTSYFEVEFHDGDNALVDPALPEYRVTDRQGADVIPLSALQKRADGIWFFFFTPTKIGDVIITFTGLQGVSNRPITIRRKVKVIRTRYL